MILYITEAEILAAFGTEQAAFSLLADRSPTGLTKLAEEVTVELSGRLGVTHPVPVDVSTVADLNLRAELVAQLRGLARLTLWAKSAAALLPEDPAFAISARGLLETFFLELRGPLVPTASGLARRFPTRELRGWARSPA